MKRGTVECHKANQSKRFVAYLIDWFIGSLVIMFPVSIYYLSQTSDVNSIDSVNIGTLYQLFGRETAIKVGIIALLLGLVYYLGIPLISRGQTLGKRIFELKIVNQDETECSYRTLIIRQLLIIIMFETYLYSISHLFIYVIEITLNTEVIKYYYSFGVIVSIVSCLFAAFTHKHLAIHDLIAKTCVVGIKTEKIDQKI